MTDKTPPHSDELLSIDAKPLRLADLDMTLEVEPGTYEARLAAVQTRLVQIQQAYLHTGHNAVVVFEGWDAAGKGGTIRRMSNVLDPRGFRVWPIAAPREADLERHYLARFWERLPEKGGIAVFDRSWYGRVLVERVEEFAKPSEWGRAYREINDFERLLTDAGTRVVKIFLAISKDEQLKRFLKRMDDPLKRWKLSVDDFRNRDRWDDYVEAIDEMLLKTSTDTAPWLVVPSDHKKFGRVTALEGIADRLGDGIDLTPRSLDPAVAKLAKSIVAKTS